MKISSLHAAIVIFLMGSSAQSSREPLQRCEGFVRTQIANSQEPELPHLERAQLSFELLSLASEYSKNLWFITSAKYRDEPTAHLEIKRDESYTLGIKALIDYFKADPQLSGLTDAHYMDSANRALRWTLVDHAERVSRTAAIEMERYRLFLIKNSIDPTKKPASWESVFKKFDFEYIRHAGPIEALMSILKERRLLPKEQNSTVSLRGMGGNRQYVYFELPEKRFLNERPHFVPAARGIFWDDVVREKGFAILLPVSAFDTFQWSHGNSFWEYGKMDDSSLMPINALAGFLNMIQKTDVWDSDLRFNSEWMFKGSIDLSKTDFRILIHPSIKQKFIDDALEEGIPQDVIDKIE